MTLSVSPERDDENTTTVAPHQDISAGQDGALSTTDLADSNLQPASASPWVPILMESWTRITLAGFGGSLVGLALQRQQQQQQQQQSSSLPSIPEGRLLPNSGSVRRTLPTKRPTPPTSSTASTLSSQQSSLAHLPRTWALSCSIFVFLLEVSRITSPTSTLLRLFSLAGDPSLWEDAEQVHTNADEKKETSSVLQTDLASRHPPAPTREHIISRPEVIRTAVVAMGDYAFGGAAAGAAGAVAQRRTLRVPGGSLGRRPSLAWGLGTGLVLGLVAGVLQAGVAIGNLYLEQAR